MIRLSNLFRKPADVEADDAPPAATPGTAPSVKRSASPPRPMQDAAPGGDPAAARGTRARRAPTGPDLANDELAAEKALRRKLELENRCLQQIVADLHRELAALRSPDAAQAPPPDVAALAKAEGWTGSPSLDSALASVLEAAAPFDAPPKPVRLPETA